MIRTDGKPTICHPNVAQAERKSAKRAITPHAPEHLTTSEYAAYKAGFGDGLARRSA